VVRHAVERYVVSRGLDLTPVSTHRVPLERWSAGALERWSAGALERWSAGALERWDEAAG
jgi:hypothetical protein